MRRAGIEPHVQRVGQLPVPAGVDAEVFVRRLEPSLDTPVLDLRRRKLEQRRRVGVQLVGFLVDEEWQRNTPLPLPRQRPVGAIRDHAVQARLAPGREEFGRVDTTQRSRA